MKPIRLYRSPVILFLSLLALPMAAWSQKRQPVNYDESVANELKIPDVLTTQAGTKVTSPEMWLKNRRPELLELFSTEVYGRTPAEEVPQAAANSAPDVPVEGGMGFMRQTTLSLGKDGELKVNLLLFLPESARKKPAPVFLLLNFWGNHAVTNEASIPISTGWFRQNKARGIVDNRATEASRGTDTASFPIGAILRRGYGVATAYYGDFDPDFDDGFNNGVHALFGKGENRSGSNWGSIGAWAWGLSRIADHLIEVPEIDSNKLGVLGHSRLGKAALWAGAQDDRLSLVISNNSGEGGVALAKRNFGETVGSITTAFPHWFAGNLKKYGDNVAALPMDQHALIALQAPRPVYIASATEDEWADPKGEFLSGMLASPVYELFGKKGLGVSEQPRPENPVAKGHVGYHLRTGPHALLEYDWERYMDFADRHWSPGDRKLEN
jgi:hypothetical protein